MEVDASYRYYRMVVAGSDKVLPVRIREPLTWIGRARGLMGTRSLPVNEGMLLRCNGIHTFWMRFPIDVVTLDRDGTIIEIFTGVPPWRIVWGRRGWVRTLELALGTAEKLGIAMGNQLLFNKD